MNDILSPTVLKKKELHTPFYTRQDVATALRDMDKSTARVLDLGCGVPLSCFDLEREYGFHQFVCVDKCETETQIMEQHSLLIDPGILQFNSFRDLHYSFTHTRVKAAHSVYDTISSFYFNYQLITRFDITTQNLYELGQFNVIILQDILHLMPFHQCISVCAQVCDLLAPGGIIYIRIPDLDDPVITDPNRSIRTGERMYENIYIPETAYLFDEYELYEISGVFERHGVWVVV